MTTTQRVDVERLSELLAAHPSIPTYHVDDQPAVNELLEALPALLQQLAAQAAEIERLRAQADEDREYAASWIDQSSRNHDEALRYKELHEAAERAREESEQDRWRTDWPEMKPYTEMHAGLWRSERVIVSLVGGMVTHDVAESFDGKRPLWFIHRDKVRAWQPFPAAFLAANGGA